MSNFLYFYILSGIISVIIFLVDIKFSMTVRILLYELRYSEFEEDQKVTVGNLLFCVALFFGVGFNLVLVIHILSAWCVDFFPRFPSKKLF